MNGAKKHSFRIRTLPSVEEFHPIGSEKHSLFADFYCRYGIAYKSSPNPKEFVNY